MIKVVGVRFQNTGKSYYFDPLEFEVRRGTHVIVETQRGKEFGTITIPPIMVQDDKVVQPLKPILRVATAEDEAQNAENREKSKEAGKICVEKIAKYGLEMKLVDTEYTFDRNKLLFYFTADGRVDFRELVKDLASVFRTRIELRQIGVRDETKIKGGMGMCGRELCCTTFLSDFAPVSIRMAKEQNLSLNPSKISGTCGRLMCCLKNEQETYEYLNKQLPKVGQRVNTIDQIEGTVQSVNILKQTAKVVLDLGGDKEIREYAAGEMAYGDHAFTCEPRSRQEDDLDYFSEQLKRAVAATQTTGDASDRKEERRGNRNQKNRSRQGGNGARGGERRSAGGRQQDAEHREPSRGQKNAASDGEKKRNGEKKQGAEQKQHNSRRLNENRRGAENRNRGGRQNGETKQRGVQTGDAQNRRTTQPEDGQKQGTGEKRRKYDRARRQGGEKTGERTNANTVKNDTQGKARGEQNATDAQGAAGDGQKKYRSRSRNRYRQNRGRDTNKEGNRQTGDTTGTKQSDS